MEKKEMKELIQKQVPAPRISVRLKKKKKGKNFLPRMK